MPDAIDDDLARLLECSRATIDEGLGGGLADGGSACGREFNFCAEWCPEIQADKPRCQPRLNIWGEAVQPTTTRIRGAIPEMPETPRCRRQ
jgi:hypothetical protein